MNSVAVLVSGGSRRQSSSASASGFTSPATTIGGSARNEVSRVEASKLTVGESRHGCFGSGEREKVGMIFGVKCCEKCPVGHRFGAVTFGFQGGERLTADALPLFLRKCRVQKDVDGQVQDCREVRLQTPERHV